MAKALLASLLLLVCVLFSFDTSVACPNGFVNESDAQSLLDDSVDGDGYHREQLLFPDINFVGCSGSVTAWTIGAQWNASNDQFPYLQIWRRAEVVMYTLIHNIELSVSGDTERPLGKYVFNGTVDPPLRFQEGDILGIFQPHRGRSRVRLNNVPGATSYTMLVGSDVFEPPSSIFTTNDTTVTSKNSQPILAIEIRLSTVDCGGLLGPSNGNVSITTTVVESAANYSCDTGFNLIGEESRLCQANGMWSGDEPVCNSIDCGGLMAPINGSITFTGTTFQSTAQYGCNQGYVLVGEGARTCQADGIWSGQKPVCNVAETQEPSGEQNITGLAAGVAVGVVGGALLLIIGAVVVVLLLRKRKVNQKYDLSAPEEHTLHNPFYTTNVGDVGAQDGRYSEVTGLVNVAPEGEKYENAVHHTDYELQRLSDSVEETYFDNPVYADLGPIVLYQNDAYGSVEAQQKALEWGIHVPTFEQRRIFSEMTSENDDPYSLTVYSALSGPGFRKQMANSSAFFDEEDMYWSPASNPNELYAQLAKRKYREILRPQIRTAEQLSSGQFGTTEKGVWQSPDGPVEVAVKTLKEAASEQDRVKFLQEAAISGQFHHPNVIKLHGVVTIGEPGMIILEFMSKGDLRTFLNEERPGPGEACPSEMPKLCLEFCRQIASGMEYLARKAFVHRDLAAKSVLVSQRRTCKIADFGMAQDLEDENYCISQGAVNTLMKWTAPEAFNIKKFSTASDVWSFGAVMYEIWSLGHKPFEGYSNQQTLRLVNEGYRLPPPSGCPRAIYSIMIKCWHPDTSSRPKFAELQQILSDTDNLLSWSEEDTKVHPQAAVLGAPLDAGKDLYPELQGKYLY